ncbi:flagellar basal body-associated FliL family protein [Paenibacillus polygoni]|uniref:Flagellar protein FliL n=1 Tax=Paenibacillus polygoni TaxID=3050112 RepID=A0ABY8XBE5_9BACL|nr:flagellar basal body-associated FliL family protein [Paenibacillus polygoni]WIV20786.1 flagellar basal body-associated FliL family protein [Paenibacillus polygoni]
MKKMLPWISTIMLAVTLIVLVVIIMKGQMNPGNEQPASKVSESKPHLSADEIVEVSSEIIDIKTNLADPNYLVQMNFAFQLDSKKANEDFEKIKDLVVTPIIIQKLAETSPETLNVTSGRKKFNSELKVLINKELTEGQIQHIRITKFLSTPMM